MKRRFDFSLAIYTIGSAVALAIAIQAYIEQKNIPEPDPEGWGAFGVGILLVLATVIGIPYGTALILKCIQLASGLRLFGILCAMIDIVLILWFGGVQTLVRDGFNAWVQFIS